MTAKPANPVVLPLSILPIGTPLLLTRLSGSGFSCKCRLRASKVAIISVDVLIVQG